jgi:dipeptidase E
VRLLLTSGGVTNTSIRDALAGLLGKPIADSSAACIPTAEWGHPMCTPASAWRFIAGQVRALSPGMRGPWPGASEPLPRSSRATA